MVLEFREEVLDIEDLELFKMSKIGIIGHYGFGLDLANGQTIKTKIITEEIKNSNHEIVTVDAHGGIKVVVPVLAVLNRIYHKKLHYIVIGGWLSNFLDRKQFLKRQLQSFNYIYVETKTMKTALEGKGFSNIVIMPNCKRLKILSEEELVYSTQEPLALCTFSRVMKEKGIGTIVDVIKRINDASGRTVYRLDIYGQVDKEQEEWFEELKKTFPSYVSYGGVVPFNESVDTLKNYFALVFPTHFFTEGIPGTIIDAYAAGVPVISAKWESFPDVIDEGSTGFGYEFDNTEELFSLLMDVLNKQDILNNMKKTCIERSKSYTKANALKPLMLAIEGDANL